MLSLRLLIKCQKDNYTIKTGIAILDNFRTLGIKGALPSPHRTTTPDAAYQSYNNTADLNQVVQVLKQIHDIDVATSRYTLSQLYDRCPPLQSVVNATADAMGTAQVRLISSNTGKEIIGGQVLNYYDQLKDSSHKTRYGLSFDKQAKVYMLVYGYAAMYHMQAVDGLRVGDKDKLVLLNPDKTIFHWSTKYVDNLNFAGKKLTHVTTTIDDRQIIIRDVNNVLFITDGFATLNNNCTFLPESRINGIRTAVRNVAVAYETRNVLLENRGMLGILSNNSNDANIAALLMNEKEELSTWFQQRFGGKASQLQTYVTSANVTYTKVSAPIDEMKLFEEIADDVAIINAQYNRPVMLSSHPQGTTTYNNIREAKSSWFNDTIIPMTNDYWNKFNDALQMKKFSLCYYEPDFSDVSIIKEEVERATADIVAKNYNTYKPLYDENFISKNTLFEKLNLPAIGGPDEFKADSLRSNDPLAVTLGVGGTQALVAILNDPNLAAETKKGTLKVLFALNDEQVNEMIKEPGVGNELKIQTNEQQATL